MKNRLTLSLTPEAYGEIRAKIEAAGYAESRISVVDGVEQIDLDDISLFSKEDKDLTVYLAYKGTLAKIEKEKNASLTGLLKFGPESNCRGGFRVSDYDEEEK